MITIKGMSKSFGSHQVLNNINIQFERGKVYGIVGGNGSGKTTFFRCLAGLDTHQGTVESSDGILKNRLGFLETDPWFFSKITGGEYIRLLCNARHIKMPNLATGNVFGLPLEQYAANYSTGMKKKLALTAILLQSNDVLILDEPFNGVDIHSNLIITEIILQLKKLNKTILIASHIFATLQNTCDAICPLQNGRFEPMVFPHDFAQLEQQMKEFAVGNRIASLGLR